jgi:hypothetical protein
LYTGVLRNEFMMIDEGSFEEDRTEAKKETAKKQVKADFALRTSPGPQQLFP